jgi:glycogen operon protein
VPEGKTWLGLIDTNQPEAQLGALPFGHVYAVTGRSLLAFGLSTEENTARRLRHSVDTILDVTEAPLA